MSTDYFKLKEPITKITIRNCEPHIKVDLFINHQLSGTLVINPDDLSDIIRLFKSKYLVAHTWSKGTEGIAITYYISSLDPCIQIINDYGELMTLGELDHLVHK